MLVRIEFFVSPELKELIGEEADKSGMPMTDFVAVTMARKVKRPDLAPKPRRAGRPRKLTGAGA